MIITDADILKEYLDLLFSDSRAYLIAVKSNPDSNSYGTAISAIQSLTQEEFKDFRDKLVDFYLESDEYKEFNYENKVIIDPFFAKILLDEPMFPFKVKSITPSTNAEYYWMTKDEGLNDYYWDDPNKPWEERKIDWNKLPDTPLEKTKLVKEMLAYKLYHTDFFNNFAKEAAFKYYVIENPGMDIEKKCSDMEQSPVPYSANLNKLDPRPIVPCIFVKPEMDAYSNWNNGDNYCYSDKNIVLTYIEPALDAVGIIGGLALMGFTGGTGTIAVAVVGAADFGVIVTSFILEKCGNWPNHEAALSNCFN